MPQPVMEASKTQYRTWRVGGKLQHFLQNWKQISNDQFILKIISEGYKLEF